MARGSPATSIKLICDANYEAFQASSGVAAIIQLSPRELATMHINLDAVGVVDDFTWQLLAGSKVGGAANFDAVADSTTVMNLDTAVHPMTTDDEFAGIYFLALQGGEAGEWRLIVDSAATGDKITLDHALSGTPSEAETYEIYRFSVWDSGIIVPLTTPTIANPQNDMTSIEGPDYFMVQGKSAATDAHLAYMTYQKDGVSV